ncbi:hypothetical protein pmac_cds_584 [Pandoravirus macleodensis]|uniref:DUF5848 domain-containing protein n=1 Tax=Pandoravirus macleodensis TaxID=2107707 RepID=A0A2U7UFS3_9VIRU|nr:hypothetical protein pmac_cds_584 [Pandoravirus macleodensis]AVK77272.1 hypothetical protein pmac_cds_584 [Pandoravirus macleodensis]UMO80012.1 hypothetical protein [Pandoravirus aubagnensis]
MTQCQERCGTRVPDMDTVPVSTYVDMAMAAVIHALDQRDVLAAGIDQLALLGVVERDLLGPQRTRPSRQTLLASAARFWRGLASLAGCGRATSLMAPDEARRWRAAMAKWPPTPLTVIRYLHDHSLCPPPLDLVDLSTGGGDILASAPTTERPDVNRADAVLEWLAADLDQRLGVGRMPDHLPYDMRAAAHVIWCGRDVDRDLTLFILVDEATATPWAAARMTRASPTHMPSVTSLAGVATSGGMWSGAPLAMAFTGAVGPGDTRAVDASFVGQPARLRRAIMAAGGATLAMRVVRVAPGALARVADRGRAVWTTFELAHALDNRQRHGPDGADASAVASAARTIRRALVGLIDRDEADEAAGRPVASALDALAPPFWDAACLLGVGTKALTRATAFEAATLASSAARVALGS